jgi:hypothetical protein
MSRSTWVPAGGGRLSGWHAAAAVTCLVASLAIVPTAGAQHARRGAPANGRGADSARTMTFNREVFQYNPAGRRDPFVSLIKSSEIRPLITDLRLTTIAYDPTGVASVAVLRDIGTKEQYRVKVGSTLGRMRVVRIDQKAVTFALEEFGYGRQETLSMGDSTSTRKP